MKYLSLILFIGISFSSLAQDKLDDLLNIHNNKAVPYISVQELAMPKTKAIILDARELDEYEVSHINNAIFVGYNDFKFENIAAQLTDRSQKIVVYCSLGIRSEDIADNLKKLGFTNVYNLYGGIFEWKNNGFKVYDTLGNETENVHAFSPMWGKWLLSGNKVYGKNSTRN